MPVGKGLRERRSRRDEVVISGTELRSLAEAGLVETRDSKRHDEDTEATTKDGLAAHEGGRPCNSDSRTEDTRRA